MRINAILSKAQSEGRDVTDEEVAQIQSETKDIEDRVFAKLREAASQ